MARVGGLRWFGQMTAPALLQPFEDPKVGIRKDDRQRVIRTTAL
jgi:hypothetical protein